MWYSFSSANDHKHCVWTQRPLTLNLTGMGQPSDNPEKAAKPSTVKKSIQQATSRVQEVVRGNLACSHQALRCIKR